jgi:Family of unknown function (DUF6113)
VIRLPLPPPPDPAPVTAWDRAGVVVVALCGALAALFETLLVPLYAGSALVPVTIVLALVSNAALPWMARTLVPSTLAALAPFAAWLVVVLGFGTIGRPEGDVILPGAPSSLEFVTYGVLLGGALAGTATVVWLTPPPAKRPPAP